VHSRDGTFVDLRNVWADSITVTGFLVAEVEPELPEPIVIQVPMAEVLEMQELRHDAKATRNTVVGGSVVLAAGLVAIGVAAIFWFGGLLKGKGWEGAPSRV
jgi:hypothetical protein